MAEAVLVLSIVNGAVGLVMKCAEVAKTLNDIVGKHKKAELTMKILIQQVDTIKAAWDRIRYWSEGYPQKENPESSDIELLRRLDQSLECGDLVLSALEDDLASYREEGDVRPRFMNRSKTVWNEFSLQNHQTRVRDQVLTMTLLLQVLSLPSASDRSTLLDASSVTLHKSDESAYSIVPSRMSVWSRPDSHISVASSEMVYSRLKLEEEIENELFASKVYKRNYRVRIGRNPTRSKPNESPSMHSPFCLPISLRIVGSLPDNRCLWTRIQPR